MKSASELLAGLLLDAGIPVIGTTDGPPLGYTLAAEATQDQSDAAAAILAGMPSFLAASQARADAEERVRTGGITVADITFRANPDGTDWLYYGVLLGLLESEERKYAAAPADPRWSPRPVTVFILVGSHTFADRPTAIDVLTELGRRGHQLWGG